MRPAPHKGGNHQKKEVLPTCWTQLNLQESKRVKENTKTKAILYFRMKTMRQGRERGYSLELSGFYRWSWWCGKREKAEQELRIAK